MGVHIKRKRRFFCGTVKTVPYVGAVLSKNRTDSLPCAKGGVANGDGGIVILSIQIQSVISTESPRLLRRHPPLGKGGFCQKAGG